MTRTAEIVTVREVRCQDGQHPTRAGQPDWYGGVLARTTGDARGLVCPACARLGRAPEPPTVDERLAALEARVAALEGAGR